MESSIAEKVIRLAVYSKLLYFSSFCKLSRLPEDSYFFINEKIYLTELSLTSFLKKKKLFLTGRSVHHTQSPSIYCIDKPSLLLCRWKVKWSRYKPGVAQRVGRGIALLFHDRGTRRGWVVSSTPQPHFTHGKDPVPILQEAGWAPGPVWTGGKSLP